MSGVFKGYEMGTLARNRLKFYKSLAQTFCKKVWKRHCKLNGLYYITDLNIDCKFVRLLSEKIFGQNQLQAYADALLVIPKALASNSGHDPQEATVKLQAEYSKSKVPVGIDLNTGEPMNPATAGVWDNFRVKRQLLNSW